MIQDKDKNIVKDLWLICRLRAQSLLGNELVNIVQELDGDEDSNAGNSATTSSASHNVDYSQVIRKVSVESLQIPEITVKNVNPISDGQKVYENARFAEVHQENEMANLDSVKGIVSPAQVAHIS